MAQEGIRIGLGASPIDLGMDHSVDVEQEPCDSRSSSSASSVQRDNILRLNRHSPANPKGPDFTIIWRNLTYKVDSRHWHTKLRERIFRTQATTDQQDSEEGSNSPEEPFKRGEKTILRSICGSAKSRQLTGILGPSGAGKSSLLYCLFQNRTQGTTGRILVDSKSKKRLRVCFIPQKDYLNEWLTVREDLIFVSKLRSSRVNSFKETDAETDSRPEQKSTEIKFTYTKQTGQQCSTTLIDHGENALRVAELLGITSCLDVPIRRISGGQKKRLSVARELMSAPDILILDEPTTGLDSLTCNKMISVLADLAHYSPHPMAVIVTIHQPQRSVFERFDKTYFLSNKGRVVYDDKPQNVIETLNKVANVNDPTAKHNPASALIEICSDVSHGYVVELMTAHAQNKFSATYDTNCIKRLMKTKSDNQGWKFCTMNERDSIPGELIDGQVNPDAGGNLDGPSFRKGSASICTDGSANSETTDEYFISRQLRDCLSSHSSSSILRSLSHVAILTHRTWLSIIRNPTMTRSRLVFHATLPLIMLLIFGTVSGKSNNCPSLGVELDISDMRKSMSDGVVKKNVEETRLTLENISFFFIVMYGFAINIISTTASHYPLTIKMFNKETINGLYSAGPYFIAQLLADLPLEIFFPSASVILAYSLSGQIASYLEWRMFASTAVIFLLCYSVHSIGLLSGSVFIDNIQVAVLAGQISLFPMILLSGVLIRHTRMPDWMKYMSNISVFGQAIKSFVAARYGFNVCECDEDMLPEDGSSITFKAMPPRVKHVLEYMFPPNRTDGIHVGEMFDKLGERFIKAQTFALNITTCDDVRPYAMDALDVEDADLYRGAVALIGMIIILKLVTFSIVRVSPYRTD